MPNDNEENPSARRLRLRRTPRAGGFRSGGAAGSTSSESLRMSSHENDEVDEAIDPEVVGRHIVRRSTQPPPADDPNNTPAKRLHEVANAGSRSWNKEYRLALLHRLLNRGIALDKIAQQLGVSISTVEKDRVELKQRLREAARELNIDEMIGGQMALYEDISAMALRVASDAGRVDQNGNVVGGVAVPMRLAGMRTALAANADKTRFLQSAGVFDILRFRRSEEGDGVSDIQMLMENTKELLPFLQGLGAEFGEDGFDAFSMQDGGDSEVLDI